MTNRGGARANAGRRANKDEVYDHIKKALAASGGAGENQDAEVALQKIWGKIITEALNGSYHYTRLFLEYYYGKPVETTNLSVDNGSTLTVVKKVVVAQKK